ERLLDRLGGRRRRGCDHLDHVRDRVDCEIQFGGGQHIVFCHGRHSARSSLYLDRVSISIEPMPNSTSCGASDRHPRCVSATSVRGSPRLSLDHSGMLPCFFGGRVTILRSSRRSAETIWPRVCEGGMTAST